MFRLRQPTGGRFELYQRFEQLLAEQNIVLEFDDDVSGAPEDQNLHVEHIEDTGSPQVTNAYNNIRRPSRRASFTSLYDTTRELSKPAAPRVSSRSSVSKLQSRSRKARSNSIDVDRTRQNNTSARPWLNDDPSNFDLLEAYGRPAQVLPTDPNNFDRFGVQQIPHFDEYHRYEKELATRASGYNQIRLQNLLHDILLQWADHCRSKQEQYALLEQHAQARDKATLLRQSFDLWRGTYLQLRHQRETERFFDHLYNRAGKARDLYLLTKAFSHWRVVSGEEVARTGVARRHILRLKYFDAWRDITVINELKAQRHGLKRPFNLLRRKYTRRRTDEVNAISVYHRNLTKSVFYRWFWSFCEAAVPRYRNSQVLDRTFQLMREKSKQSAQQEHQAESFHREKILRKTTNVWATATRIDLGGNHQADSFRKSKLVIPLLDSWKTESKLAPLEKQIKNIRDWRLARAYFSVLVARNRTLKEAESRQSLHVKQNAWRSWNGALRVRAMQSQIQERLTLQCLYKWVLQERAALMTRVHEGNLKRRVLRTITSHHRTKKERLQQQEILVRKKSNTNVLSFALNSWIHQHRLLKERKQIASNYYNPQIQLDSLDSWHSQLVTLRKYDNWARDAHFYFTAFKVMKRWSAAAQEAEKKRRQAAYAAVRKVVKTNIARKTLHRWHNRMQHVASLRWTSENVADKQLREHVAAIFTTWRNEKNARLQHVNRAEENYREHLLNTTFTSWHDSSQGLQNLENRAINFHRLHISELCSVQLRKLSLKAFEIRCREQVADAARERHFDKHIRRMFKHWSERTRVQMLEGLSAVADALDEPSPEVEKHQFNLRHRLSSPQSRPRSNNRPIKPEHDIPRAEERTALDSIMQKSPPEIQTAYLLHSAPLGPYPPIDPDDSWIPPLEDLPPTVAASTPAATPGYLSTPSKRAVRARALANLSTTPAGLPPIRTPFAARLKGEKTAEASESGSTRNRSLALRTPAEGATRSIGGRSEETRTARKVVFEDMK